MVQVSALNIINYTKKPRATLSGEFRVRDKMTYRAIVLTKDNLCEFIEAAKPLWTVSYEYEIDDNAPPIASDGEVIVRYYNASHEKIKEVWFNLGWSYLQYEDGSWGAFDVCTPKELQRYELVEA